MLSVWDLYIISSFGVRACRRLAENLNKGELQDRIRKHSASSLSIANPLTESINYPNVHRLWVYNDVCVGNGVCIAVAGFCWYKCDVLSIYVVNLIRWSC